MMINRIHNFLVRESVSLRSHLFGKKEEYIPLKTVKMIVVFMLKGDFEKYLDVLDFVDMEKLNRIQNDYVKSLNQQENKKNSPPPPPHKQIHQPVVDKTDEPPKKEVTTLDFGEKPKPPKNTTESR